MINENQTPGIPSKGQTPEQILDQIRKMKEEDVGWKKGKVWSLVYYAGDDHDQLLKAAHSELFSTNYLNPIAFKSLHKMEQEVVRMSVSMLNGGDKAVGLMTSGGTESILLAIYCYRERARSIQKHIHQPEVVAPETIHPAFDKAAHMFGIRLRKAPVDENKSVIPSEMERLINANTILMVASAPSYPHGVMDPIETVAEIATRHNIPLHVDACIGGFMLPWVEKLGYDISTWDFRISGVSSISADVHKFGYGAKGASLLLYRTMELMRHQFVVTTDFPGGIYISPTLLGTRPGGPIAAAWAGMRHLGEEGYLRQADELMKATIKLKNGLSAIPEISIVGKPCMNLIAYTTKNNRPDIFVIADQLEENGWMMDRQQYPDCIHMTVLPTNVNSVDEYLNDLREAIRYAAENPGAIAKGNAAIYGLMSRIPFRGMVEKTVRKIMEDMYGVKDYNESMKKRNINGAIANNTKWMGFANRLLSAWARRK